jgi:uncharacterized protein YndB with AHSA1/START domain
MQRDIKHEFTFSQPPEVVWEYLTDAELLAEWLMPNDFKLTIGHKFQFKTKPKIKLGFDGTIYCEVLEIVPQKKLVYSWRGGMSKEKPSLDSIVTWTLMPSGNNTILKLEHAGFKGLRNFLPYLIMNKGWLKIGKRLITKSQPAHV